MRRIVGRKRFSSKSSCSMDSGCQWGGIRQVQTPTATPQTSWYYVCGVTTSVYTYVLQYFCSSSNQTIVSGRPPALTFELGQRHTRRPPSSRPPSPSTTNRNLWRRKRRWRPKVTVCLTCSLPIYLSRVRIIPRLFVHYPAQISPALKFCS